MPPRGTPANKDHIHEAHCAPNTAYCRLHSRMPHVAIRATSHVPVPHADLRLTHAPRPTCGRRQSPTTPRMPTPYTTLTLRCPTSHLRQRQTARSEPSMPYIHGPRPTPNTLPLRVQAPGFPCFPDALHGLLAFYAYPTCGRRLSPTTQSAMKAHTASATVPPPAPSAPPPAPQPASPLLPLACSGPAAPPLLLPPPWPTTAPAVPALGPCCAPCWLGGRQGRVHSHTRASSASGGSSRGSSREEEEGWASRAVVTLAAAAPPLKAARPRTRRSSRSPVFEVVGRREQRDEEMHGGRRSCLCNLQELQPPAEPAGSASSLPFAYDQTPGTNPAPAPGD